jgi:hypothetical protein
VPEKRRPSCWSWTSARSSETIIAVISRTGAIDMVDDDGYTIGTVLAPNRIEMCRSHAAHASLPAWR